MGARHGNGGGGGGGQERRTSGRDRWVGQEGGTGG